MSRAVHSILKSSTAKHQNFTRWAENDMRQDGKLHSTNYHKDKSRT